LKAKSVILLFGRSCEFNIDEVNIPLNHLTYIEDDEVKAKAYSAEDIFLCPSRSDNSPNIVSENMACGTPVIAFRASGLPELVRTGISGLLAEPENANSFRDKIAQLLEDENLRETIKYNCRKLVSKEYSVELWSRRYIDLYRNVIQAHNTSNRLHLKTQRRVNLLAHR
jgi:glycosyltransferase involved in cell wall biosynthesis